jgi:hypothetical protein
MDEDDDESVPEPVMVLRMELWRPGEDGHILHAQHDTPLPLNLLGEKYDKWGAGLSSLIELSDGISQVSVESTVVRALVS